MIWFWTLTVTCGMAVLWSYRRVIASQREWLVSCALILVTIVLFVQTVPGGTQLEQSPHLSLGFSSPEGVPAMSRVVMSVDGNTDESWLVPIRLRIPFGQVLLSACLILVLLRMFVFLRGDSLGRKSVDLYGLANVSLVSMTVLWFGLCRWRFDSARDFSAYLDRYDTGTIKNVVLPTDDLVTPLDTSLIAISLFIIFAIVIACVPRNPLETQTNISSSIPIVFLNSVLMGVVLAATYFMFQAQNNPIGQGDGYALVGSMLMAGLSSVERDITIRVWCAFGLFSTGVLSGILF